jgi:hypothetical protein
LCYGYAIASDCHRLFEAQRGGRFDREPLAIEANHQRAYHMVATSRVNLKADVIAGNEGGCVAALRWRLRMSEYADDD